MNGLNITDFFLRAIVTYGPLVLGLALFIGALGIPLPGTLFVLAAGAFVQQGLIDGMSASVLALLGSVLGDSASYAIGRFARKRRQRGFGQSNVAAWQKAQETFDRRGGIAIYFTRFLLLPLAMPTNFIAGSSAYLFRRFLLYDTAGQLTWIVLYGGLGYVFGSQWELISQLANDLNQCLAGIVVVGIGIYLLYLLLRRCHR